MKLNVEYKKITSEILENENFILLKNDVHHGSNKYDHCKRVSYLSFIMAKIFRGNCRSVARAGLLHDFFFGSRTEKDENDYLKHPKSSARNAKLFFNIDGNEGNIIETHMFHYALVKRFTPFLKKYQEDKVYYRECKPKNKDGVIVCAADLLVSIFEVLVFKIRYSFCLYMLFLLNLVRY